MVRKKTGYIVDENKQPINPEPFEEPLKRSWREDLTDRERKEIEFAEDYAANFNHGTDGHIRLNLISMMAKLLDNKEIE